MLSKLQYLTGQAENFPIFVIGQGRSGTHWIAECLSGHPEIYATIEQKPVFQWVTKMAIDHRLESRLYGRLTLVYKWKLLRAAPRSYLDKSHPNLWLVEKLQATFPKAKFVGIERNPYAQIASSIRNGAETRPMHLRWREYPVPNRYYGIAPEMVDSYEAFSTARKCAIRWVAHHKRMREVRERLGDSLYFVGYEEFADDPSRVVEELQHFLGLTRPLQQPEVRRDALDKWRAELSAQDIVDIEAVVGFGPQ